MSWTMRTIVKNCWLIFCVQNCLVALMKLIRTVIKNKHEITIQQVKYMVTDILYNLIEIYVNALYRTPVTAQ